MSKRSSPSSFSREFPKSFCEDRKQKQRWSGGTMWIRHFSGFRPTRDAARVAEYNLFFLLQRNLCFLNDFRLSQMKWGRHLYLFKVNQNKKTLWIGQLRPDVFFLFNTKIYLLLLLLTQAFQLPKINLLPTAQKNKSWFPGGQEITKKLKSYTLFLEMKAVVGTGSNVLAHSNYELKVPIDP